jgi:pseudouridine-5'-phosphate glycosidase
MTGGREGAMPARPDWLGVSDEVALALAGGRPVVALESTLIAHGLPFPTNVETAEEAERAVRAGGAVPATVAVWEGRPTVGLSREQIAALARMTGVLKASRRDLATAVVKRKTAATTVAATMHLAHAAGIAVFATGGTGGAHRDAGEPFDISADLVELARTPVLVVCAGAKSILHLPRTLEILETLGVPVVGYRTDTLPAFYVRDSGLPLPARADDPAEAARLFTAHRSLGGAGMVLAQPVDEGVALPSEEFDSALRVAEAEAAAKGVRGAALTPFLLGRLAALTGGRSLRANRALIVANARLAAEVAGKLLDERWP